MAHQFAHSVPLWRIWRKSMIAAIVVLGITTPPTSASEARFVPLPPDFWPGEISGDGSVVVGKHLSPPDCAPEHIECDQQPALWTEAEGLELLGDGSHGFASDVSADGSVIVGLSDIPSRQAFRWTRESGMVGLGYLPRSSRTYSSARGVSGDGSVVVGSARKSGIPGGFGGYRWTEETGMVSIDESSSARRVSWSGSVIVGQHPTLGTAFRWTSQNGLTHLETDFDWLIDGTVAMSVDGRLIVGSANVTGGANWEPRQWTESGGIEKLPNWESTFPWPNGRGDVHVQDMSDDGTYVLGDYVGPGVTGSFIWDEEHGFRDLHDLLVNDYGLATEMANWGDEWTLDGAQAISYDGRRIVGHSSSLGCTSTPFRCIRGGWLAILGPPFQPGDANRDDLFNSSDLVHVFQVGEYEDDVAGNSLWKDGDWNWDGDFTSSDLVAAFEAGGYEQEEQGAVIAVPEPTSVVLLMVSLIGIAIGARRRHPAGAGETVPNPRHQCWSAQRRICTSMIAAIFVLGITTTLATASEARFIPLPEDFVPFEMSGDGSVVVGWNNSPPGCIDSDCRKEAALWTEAGGVERLGFMGEAKSSRAYHVSADGSVIVGQSLGAFRWTRESGMVGLGKLPGGDRNHPRGVSGDGSVVVGAARNSKGQYEGYRWTVGNGMVSIGGNEAIAVSWDGSVIAGRIDRPRGGNPADTAFRWTIETGLTDLGEAPGESSIYGWPPNDNLAMSVDGQLIVASVQFTGKEWEPRQWTEAGGIEMLPNWESTFPWLNGEGPYESEVKIRDMSDDGTYVLGDYLVYEDGIISDFGISGSFIWDAEHGFRDLHDLLVNDYGLATEMANWSEEWNLDGTRAISYDGRRILGFSSTHGCLSAPWTCPTRGWLAILGPPYQPGDANRDDVFNSSDLVQVFQGGHYEDDVAGNSLWKDGDWNWDGDFTSSDLVAAFMAGGYEPGEQEAVNAVPESSAASLFATGLCGLLPIWFFRRRR